jgi:ferric-dicitrate binding protein FerR (iron transport regulator)
MTTLPFPHSWFQSLEYSRGEYFKNPSKDNRDKLAWAATMLSIKVDSWRLSEIVEEIDEEHNDGIR